MTFDKAISKNIIPGGENINIKLLKTYINRCNHVGIEPTWEGLKRFKHNSRKYPALNQLIK